jgi:RNA polymerase sigma-70 factor, ECF subfamily
MRVVKRKGGVAMRGNDSTSSVGDDEAAEATGDRGPTSPRECHSLGPLLQSFRAYLLAIADRELSPNLRGKCGASDVVQETFREAHRDWTRFRGNSPQELRAWLRGILLNNIRDAGRGYQQTKRDAGLEQPIGPQVLESLVDPELTPRATACAREEAVAVARAIAGLPDDYQRVIEMRNRENRSFQEIGRDMGRSPDAARMLWFRAIESLRRELVNPHAT